MPRTPESRGRKGGRMGITGRKEKLQWGNGRGGRSRENGGKQKGIEFGPSTKSRTLHCLVMCYISP